MRFVRKARLDQHYFRGYQDALADKPEQWPGGRYDEMAYLAGYALGSRERGRWLRIDHRSA